MASRRSGIIAPVLLAALLVTTACSSGITPPDTRVSQAMATVVAGLQAQLSPTAVPTAAPAASPPPVVTKVPGVLGSSLAQALAAAPPVVGQPVTVTTDDGERLTVTVNAIVDPAQSTFKYNQPKGRFVVVDWTLTNDGEIGHGVSPFAFELQTTDGFVYKFGISAGLSQPDMHSGTVAQGQTMRGYLAYDIPAGAVLKSAIYQPLGNRQFVIADLAP